MNLTDNKNQQSTLNNIKHILNAHTSLHEAIVDGIYYKKWDIPLTRTIQYIDELWEENYSEYKDIHDFEFTEQELSQIYEYAQEEAKDIDISYIKGALGDYKDYKYIIEQVEKYLFVTPRLKKQLELKEDEEYVLFKEVDTSSEYYHKIKAFVDKNIPLAERFIINFDFIYNNPSLKERTTIVKEMQNYVDTIKKEFFEIEHESIFAYKYYKMDEIWAFYSSANAIANMDDDEYDIYQKFIKELEKEKDINESFKLVFELKEKDSM